MSAPRVLLVSALQIHPTVSGGTLRSYALARALARRGLDVRVHSLTGRKADYRARRASSVETWPGGIAERVERGPVSVIDWLGGFVLGLPPLWLAARLAGAAATGLLPRALRESLAWCDVVVADFPWVAPVLRARAAREKLRVLSTHNVEHHLRPGRTAGRRALRTAVRALERAAARDADLVVSCCDADARALAALSGRPAIVVANGVERDRFRFAAGDRERARRALGLGPEDTVFLFAGSKWGPNRDALESLVFLARSSGPALAAEGIHVLAVGSMADRAERLPFLTVTGRVDAAEPFFAAADAAINPVASGAGTNLKTGEFIAAGLPLLTTSFGARGYDLRHGHSAFLFDPEDTAAALAEVRRLFRADPAAPATIAARALEDNAAVVDMDACVEPLAAALASAATRSEAAMVRRTGSGPAIAQAARG
jgi:glycosyltransferase involved in cell wall biosynthesis